MKTILKLECPYCNAPLEYEEGKEQMFCQYCGKKILLVDENTYNINHTIRQIDEAEIKRTEAQKAVELKKIEFAEKKRAAKERTKKNKVFFSMALTTFSVLMMIIGILAGSASGNPESGYYVIASFGFLLLMLSLLGWQFPSIDIDDDYDFGTIRLPLSIGDYENTNYEVIEAQIAGAGFTNIRCVPLHDLTFGIFTKSGNVESITINGQPISSLLKRYQPDAPIVISYHSK